MLCMVVTCVHTSQDMGTLAERRKKAEVKEAERLERERRLESLRTQVGITSEFLKAWGQLKGS